MSPRAGIDTAAVVEAAAALADERGAENITLAALAERLGVKPPSLYNHIESLGELKTALAVRGLEQLHRALEGASRSGQGDDVLLAMGAAYLAFARSRPGLYELTLRAPGPEEQALSGAGERLLGLIAGCFQGRGWEEERVIHAVRGLRSLLHGFASLEGRGGFGIPLEVGTSLQLALRAYLAGLTVTS